MEKNITPDSVISALMNHTKSADSDFPVHVFPAKMQRIILELNTTCAFPIDYTASAMLAAISVAIGNTHRVERIARFFGGPGYSVSNFVEHIINEHLDSNSTNYESWFTLISKSF